MGTKYLLDSNTVIDYIGRQHPDKGRQWLNQVIDDEINVSIIESPFKTFLCYVFFLLLIFQYFIQFK